MTEVQAVRAFFAINLADPLREEIVGKIAPLRRKSEPLRWVPAENLHVTLRFLGDVTPSLRRDVEEKVEEVTAGITPFRFRLGGAGAFPSLRSPRVLWVGVSEGGEEIRELAQGVERVVRALGFEKEKRFHSHITVARTKGRLSPAFRERYGDLAIEPLEQAAGALHLMKSTLTPQGAVYDVLAEFPFRG